MEKRDYILREIEKIGSIIQAISNSLFGGKESITIKPEKQLTFTKEMLLVELKFDLDKFLLMNMEESDTYLNSFTGFNEENTDLLASCFSHLALSEDMQASKVLLEKALQLYELINIRTNTYSFERQSNIIELKNLLSNN